MDCSSDCRRVRMAGVLAGVLASALVIGAPTAAAAPAAPAPTPPTATTAAATPTTTPTTPPTTPRTAATPATPVVPAHPDDDHMGSTIRRYEPTTLATATPRMGPGQVAGMDVSRWQGNVDWRTAYGRGARFAYVKATESTTYTNPYFAQQYNGSAGVGMVRGAYHFALPNSSSGAAQATYFVNHGGGWSADGRTLPPMLDIEYNPYGSNICYGLSPSAMSSWIADFSNTVHARTGRFPTIYSTTNWWNTCTGSNSRFGANPLFIARYASTVGTLPPSWSNYTLWQYSDSGAFPGDQDVFRGDAAALKAFAGVPAATPKPTPTPTPTTPAPSTSAVTAYYASLGGAKSYLGAASGAAYAVAGGVGQDYAGGTIYWSQKTGAHAVHGTILARYKALGGPASRLGFPTSDELAATDGRGRYGTFANTASLYWNPATNVAFALTGPARDKYVALGGPAGLLAYPTNDTTTTPDGIGTFTHFAGAGGSIYVSPATAAHEVHGTIAARWASLGWERSSLGYPTSDEQVIAGGRRSTFAHGAISWNAATGATTISTA